MRGHVDILQTHGDFTHMTQPASQQVDSLESVRGDNRRLGQAPRVKTNVIRAIVLASLNNPTPVHNLVAQWCYNQRRATIQSGDGMSRKTDGIQYISVHSSENGADSRLS